MAKSSTSTLGRRSPSTNYVLTHLTAAIATQWFWSCCYKSTSLQGYHSWHQHPTQCCNWTYLPHGIRTVNFASLMYTSFQWSCSKHHKQQLQLNILQVQRNDWLPSLRWPSVAVSVNVTVWRPSVRLSVCPIFFITVIERVAHTQHDSLGAARDEASVHFRPSITRMNILAAVVLRSVTGNLTHTRCAAELPIGFDFL